MNIEEAIAEIQQPRSRFQLIHFVLGQHDTPEMRFYQLCLELQDMKHKLALAEIQVKKSEIEIKRLLETGDDLDALDAEEKLLELGKKEAIKKGMDAVFGEDDNFVSPYETASVDYDEYKMGMGGTTAQGGVIDFPGAIKSADPATISYLWKQRMNSYVGKA